MISCCSVKRVRYALKVFKVSRYSKFHLNKVAFRDSRICSISISSWFGGRARGRCRLGRDVSSKLWRFSSNVARGRLGHWRSQASPAHPTVPANQRGVQMPQIQKRAQPFWSSQTARAFPPPAFSKSELSRAKLLSSKSKVY